MRFAPNLFLASLTLVKISKKQLKNLQKACASHDMNLKLFACFLTFGPFLFLPKNKFRSHHNTHTDFCRSLQGIGWSY